MQFLWTLFMRNKSHIVSAVVAFFRWLCEYFVDKRVNKSFQPLVFVMSKKMFKVNDSKIDDKNFTEFSEQRLNHSLCICQK